MATLAKVEEPISAEVVYSHTSEVEIGCAGGHGFGCCFPTTKESSYTSLVVHRDPEIRVGLHPYEYKSSTELRLDVGPKSERVAYWVADEWRIVYLGKDAGFLDDRVAGTAETVDWAKARSFDDASAYLFEHAISLGRKALVKEVRRRSGATGVVRLLEQTIDVESSDQDWDVAYADLSEKEREPLRERLVRALIEGEGTSRRLHSAIRNLDLRSESLDEPVEKRTRALAKDPAKDPASLAALLHASRLIEPACEVVGREKEAIFSPSFDFKVYRPKPTPPPASVAVKSALWVLASHRAECDSVSAAAEASEARDASRLCDNALYCKGEDGTDASDPGKSDAPPHLCTRSELDRDVDAISKLESKAFLDAADSHDQRLKLWLAALYAQKALPVSLARHAARRAYAIDETDAGKCQDVEAGSPCACPLVAVRTAACEAELDASVGKTPWCTFAIDDSSKAVKDMRSIVVRYRPQPKPDARAPADAEE